MSVPGYGAFLSNHEQTGCYSGREVRSREGRIPALRVMIVLLFSQFVNLTSAPTGGAVLTRTIAPSALTWSVAVASLTSLPSQVSQFSFTGTDR